MWQIQVSLSHDLFDSVEDMSIVNVYILQFLASLLAPLIGFLADVKFGRYEMIKIGTLAFFFGNMFSFMTYFVSWITWLNIIFSAVQFMLFSFGLACFSVAILPFLTDQIIGASSDELSSVVRWYVWTSDVGILLNQSVRYLLVYYSNIAGFYVPLVFAISLAGVIISDCLCQQWLDRTHKVTNPIKLIVQVLNYTRKHRYPERRSAFTYIDEEQPTRMDYGKDKFGGPFTEEEVEDVKTVLRLLPLVICLSATGTLLFNIPILIVHNKYAYLLNIGWHSWLFPLVLIPLYQVLLRRCACSCRMHMIIYIGIGLALYALGYLLLGATLVWRVVLSHGVHKYLSCVSTDDTDWPHVDWYWKLVPCILYGTGSTMTNVLFLEFIIAQSPDKMKGFVIGVKFGIFGIVCLIGAAFYWITFTICCDIVAVVVLVVLFVVFLVLSKRYTLRERNREINIQAIVEEHYERYMDQEEEYMRENPQYFSDSDSD